jgi:4-hydroxybenzoate polyprenyltransferase
LQNQGEADRGPLCVDLEGTLVRSDLTMESGLASLKQKPWLLLVFPFWIFRGMAYIKARIADRIDMDVSALPYRQEVLQLIGAARDAGRPVWLVSGGNIRYAERVAAHLGLFARVLASDESINMNARAKTARIREILNGQPFEYVGRRASDMAIWESAAGGFAVEAARGVTGRLTQMGKLRGSIASSGESRRLRIWFKALRLHQWAKNALIFVPLITAHRLFDPPVALNALAAFISVGLCASATYIINDLLDLEADRFHLKKRNRPFASGTLSVKAGLLACVTLMAFSWLIALQLPALFQFALLSYIVITLGYSMWFKRIASLDVITLTSLYTLRVVAGAWAVNIRLSFWLLAFSMFLFLCLALAKRVAELIDHEKQLVAHGDRSRTLRGREYGPGDTVLLQTMGVVSGYVAVLVLALYINSPEVVVLYSSPQMLWFVAPALLLWITRLWVVTSRGYMDQDPISFAIRDPETWGTALITAAALLAASTIG